MTHPTRADTPWRVLLPRWSQPPGPDRPAWTDIIADLGGSIDDAGEICFRRYRAAEMCAYALHARLDVWPEVRLAFEISVAPQ
jgi:hypothetical protein